MQSLWGARPLQLTRFRRVLALRLDCNRRGLVVPALPSYLQVGAIVTAWLPPSVGAEKCKSRPVVVVGRTPQTLQVVAMSDADKKHIPTHVLLGHFDSGTSCKPAVVTCEHFWSLDASRLSERHGCRALNDDELRAVRGCLLDAFGLLPFMASPRARPRMARGDLASIDFAGGIGAEVNGVVPAVVLSNNIRNFHGRTLLVAPLGDDSAVVPVPTSSGVVDLGRARIADVDRLRSEAFATLDAESVARVDCELNRCLLAAWAGKTQAGSHSY